MDGKVRGTTYSDYYAEPGNPLFNPPGCLGMWEGAAPSQRLEEILDQDWN